MSELDTIASQPVAKRKLKKFSFEYPGAEVSYTDASQGGAASMMNEPFLLKSNNAKPVLTKEQQAILDTIGEDVKPIQKADEPNPSSSVSENAEGELKIEGDDMSTEALQKMQEQVEQLTKALKVSELEKSLAGYDLNTDTATGLANVIADLDEAGVAAVTKSLDEIAAKVVEVEAEKVEEVEKASEVAEQEENELAKSLSKETGHEEAQAAPVAKSMVEQLKELEGNA